MTIQEVGLRQGARPKIIKDTAAFKIKPRIDRARRRTQAIDMGKIDHPAEPTAIVSRPAGRVVPSDRRLVGAQSLATRELPALPPPPSGKFHQEPAGFRAIDSEADRRRRFNSSLEFFSSRSGSSSGSSPAVSPPSPKQLGALLAGHWPGDMRVPPPPANMRIPPPSADMRIPPPSATSTPNSATYENLVTYRQLSQGRAVLTRRRGGTPYPPGRPRRIIKELESIQEEGSETSNLIRF